MGDRAGGDDFLDRVPIAAALLTRDGSTIVANERLAELLARPATSMVGADVVELVHPEDAEEIGRLLLEVDAKIQPNGLRVPARLLDGDGRGVEVVLTGLDLLAEPGIGGVLVLVRVDDQQVDRPGSGGWFEAVIGASQDIVQVVDEHGRFVWASGPLERVLGLTSEAMIGRTIANVRSDVDPRPTAAWFESVLRCPGLNPMVVGPRITVDGSHVYLEVRANNLLHDPAVRGVVLHTRDISDRVEVEEARHFALDVVARAPIAIATADALGAITSWNDAAEAMLGWSAEEVRGRRFGEIGIQSSDSFGSVVVSLENVLRGGFVEMETHVNDRTGARIPVYLVLSGLLDADGSFSGYLLFGIDLRPEVEARSALAGAEARWATMARSSQELVALLEEDGTIRWAGAGFTNLLGLDANALVGTNAREYVHPEDGGRPDGFAASIARGDPPASPACTGSATPRGTTGPST